MDIASVLGYAVPLIRAYEGFSSKPYLCPAGVPTIGYGSTFYEDGRRVLLTDFPIDERYATALLIGSIMSRFLPKVESLCPTLEDPRQTAAITSWTYNLGAGNLAASTMRKRILEKDWEGAAAELQKWNKAKGKVQKGLVSRRATEAKLFLAGS